MKKILIYGLAAGLVCAIGGTVLAEDDFSGYPDDLQIWTGITTLRVRDTGKLSFGDSDDVSFAYDTGSAGVNITRALNYGGLSTNTSSALVVDFTPNIALNTGVMISFVAHTDCGAGATLNVDSLGAKAIYEVSDGTAVEAGDITSGTPCLLIYYNSLWYQLSQSGN